MTQTGRGRRRGVNFTVRVTEAEREALEAYRRAGGGPRAIGPWVLWRALENPTGLLGHYLGTPRDVWQPCDFGDPHTKRTAVWGDFTIPQRGPFVEPTGTAMSRPTAAERAITPPGFARAFMQANP